MVSAWKEGKPILMASVFAEVINLIDFRPPDKDYPNPDIPQAPRAVEKVFKYRGPRRKLHRGRVSKG
jgi:hypothetical protein